MKVVLFGATGPTGRLILKNLLSEGHEVTCFVRNPDRLQVTDMQVKISKGSILDKEALGDVVKGSDLVISALGTKPTLTSTVMSDATRFIVDAMEQHGVPRIILVSTLGIKETKGMMGAWFTYLLQPFVLRNNFREKERQEDILQKSSLDWISVRPALLTNGPLTETYKAGFSPGEKIRAKISRADVAHFIANNVAEPSFHKKAVNLSC